MLREVGKRDRATLEAFLDEHAHDDAAHDAALRDREVLAAGTASGSWTCHHPGEALEHEAEIRLVVKHLSYRVSTTPLHPLDRALDGERAGIERLVDFVPSERHRDARSGKRPNAER